MAGDSSLKSEKPTPKRLKEGVERGQVARSADIAAWAGLLAMVLFLPWIVGTVSDELQVLLHTLPVIASEPSVPRLLTIAESALTAIALTLLPFLLGMLLITQVSGWAQGGARPYLKRIAPKVSNLSPAQAVKRIFGPRGLWELTKQLLKTATIGIVVWVVIQRTVEILFGSGVLPLSVLAQTAAAEGIRLMQIVIAVGLVIAIADYFVSRARVRKDLRMSRREVLDEMKQSEGDPLLRGALRQRALAASRNRMMLDVTTADVVLVNPTHVAVALKYTQQMGAPRVVAKGAGVVAARIREIAAEQRIPMVEDIPLARALYRSCELGDEIPQNVYTAVARILAFVMGLRKKGAPAGFYRAREVDLAIPL